MKVNFYFLKFSFLEDFKNDKLEFFYKNQNLFSDDDDFKNFMKHLTIPLPITFRINQTNVKKSILLNDHISNWIKKLEKIKVGESQKLVDIRCLNWFPNKMAYQIDIAKADFRKTKEFNEFRLYINAQTEQGFISRQETVSMIPPLFMDIEPHHKVLDMCAAPGSKTAQLVEQLFMKDSNPSKKL